MKFLRKPKMGSKAYKLSAPFFLLLAIIFSIAFPCSNAVSSCDGPCRTQDDCRGQLICVSGKCNDDPDVGSNICGGGDGGENESPPSGSCRPSGHLYCDGESYPKYYCSPPVTSSTQASLTLNDFSKGGDGGSKSECDDDWHGKSERVVALSTGWYDGGSRCGKKIRIAALHNGRSVEAMVVDECDSRAGCDGEHGGQPPCRNNVVDGSDAVWEALGLDKDIGVVPITWSMA